MSAIDEAAPVSGRWSDRVDNPKANHLTSGSGRGETRDDSPVFHSVGSGQTPRPPRNPADDNPDHRSTQTDRIARDLTDLDLAVLDTLSVVRMASGRQLNCLHWPMTPSGSRQTRRRLQRLTDLRLLTRLHRQVGGIKGGSQGYTYALDTMGQRITQAHHLRTIRQPTPSDFFVDHTLGVTEIFVHLRTTRTASFQLLDYQPEPECWREFTGPAGRPLTLRPDAFAAWVSGEWELSAFFEVDRATEHPGRVTRKAEQCVRYWHTGAEQRTHDVFPSVVWVTPTERRSDELRAVIAGLDPAAQSLFEVITDNGLPHFFTNQPREEGHP